MAPQLIWSNGICLYLIEEDLTFDLYWLCNDDIYLWWIRYLIVTNSLWCSVTLFRIRGILKLSFSLFFPSFRYFFKWTKLANYYRKQKRTKDTLEFSQISLKPEVVGLYRGADKMTWAMSCASLVKTANIVVILHESRKIHSKLHRDLKTNMLKLKLQNEL